MIDFACFYDWEMGFCLFSRLGDVILPVFTIGGCDFETVPTVWYFLFFILLQDVIRSLFLNGLPHIRVITKLPNSEQSYKGKVKTHNYINRQNQSTTGKL